MDGVREPTTQNKVHTTTMNSGPARVEVPNHTTSAVFEIPAINGL